MQENTIKYEQNDHDWEIRNEENNYFLTVTFTAIQEHPDVAVGTRGRDGCFWINSIITAVKAALIENDRNESRSFYGENGVKSRRIK